MGLTALVIDGSAVRRQRLVEALRGMPGVGDVEMSNTLGNALRRLQFRPVDLVVVDADLDGRGGIDAVSWIGSRLPEAVCVVLGSEAPAGADDLRRAVGVGGSAWLTRPGRDESTEAWIAAVRTGLAAPVAQARARRPATAPRPADAPLPLPAMSLRYWAVAVGVSAGGPESLMSVIPRLPAKLPVPVLLVQHMPAGFTATLAERLNRASAVQVVEAQDGDDVRAGTVYVAPGGWHMTVARGSAGRPVVRLNQDEALHGCRPAADVLFRSMAGYPDPRGVLAVVMTGMGRDGRDGVRAIRNAGGICLTQSAETCMIYGMPRAVVEAGLSDDVAPLDRLAARIVDHLI